MTREEAKQIIASWLANSKGRKGNLGYIEGWFYEKDVEAFNMAIDALEKESNEDCISRADVIESFLADNECEREEAKACMCSLDSMLELIEDTPSVMPTERTQEPIVRCRIANNGLYFESVSEDEYMATRVRGRNKTQKAKTQKTQKRKPFCFFKKV